MFPDTFCLQSNSSNVLYGQCTRASPSHLGARRFWNSAPRQCSGGAERPLAAASSIAQPAGASRDASGGAHVPNSPPGNHLRQARPVRTRSANSLGDKALATSKNLQHDAALQRLEQQLASGSAGRPINASKDFPMDEFVSVVHAGQAAEALRIVQRHASAGPRRTDSKQLCSQLKQYHQLFFAACFRDRQPELALEYLVRQHLFV